MAYGLFVLIFRMLHKGVASLPSGFVLVCHKQRWQKAEQHQCDDNDNQPLFYIHSSMLLTMTLSLWFDDAHHHEPVE